MRATGRIVTLRGRGEIPRLSAEARLVHGELAPSAQVGRVADAVEVYDPSGILTVCEDLPDGSGVRLGVSGLAGTADPETGATLSVPLRDVAGRELGPIRATLAGAPTFGAQFAIRELRAWAQHALPSGAAYWIGIGGAPFRGDADTEGDYQFWGVINDAPGSQRLMAHDRELTAPPDTRTALAGDWSIRGVRAAYGTPSGWRDNQATYVGMATPYELRATASLAERLQFRATNTNSILWPEGAVPHLYFGVGSGGVADEVEFAPLVAALDLVALMGAGGA